MLPILSYFLSLSSQLQSGFLDGVMTQRNWPYFFGLTAAQLPCQSPVTPNHF